MPRHWTAARIAKHLHDTVLAADGFQRFGQRIERSDGGLRRTLSVHTRATGSRPEIQLLAGVALNGLPEPVGSHRADSLGGTATTASGRSSYRLTRVDQPLDPELLFDVRGPIRRLLLVAEDLRGFITWAQEVFLGEEHPSWWGPFKPVIPQGTGPLEAATFAAVTLRDTNLVDFLATRVENEQNSEQRFKNFSQELRHLYPDFQRRHPLQQPPT